MEVCFDREVYRGKMQRRERCICDLGRKEEAAKELATDMARLAEEIKQTHGLTPDAITLMELQLHQQMEILQVARAQNDVYRQQEDV